MTMVFARIIVRYVSGAMMAYGFIPTETANQIAADPDLIAIIGAGLAVLTEGVYALAKKRGWAT